MGCHGNHALQYSPHKLFLRTMFSHLGSPIEQFGTMNTLAPMRNCPVCYARYVNLLPGISV